MSQKDWTSISGLFKTCFLYGTLNTYQIKREILRVSKEPSNRIKYMIFINIIILFLNKSLHCIIFNFSQWLLIMKTCMIIIPRRFISNRFFENNSFNIFTDETNQTFTFDPFSLFSLSISPGCTFLRDGNFLFYVKVTFTWFADNLCTSNFCSVILSGELDFGARIVEDLTLRKWESFLLARSSVCTFFENSFNGNKPWKIECFESFLISMHFPDQIFRI